MDPLPSGNLKLYYNLSDMFIFYIALINDRG